MNIRKLVSILAVAALAGCTMVKTSDIEVQTEADPKCSFSGYKTYAWLGGAVILNDPEGQWEPPGFEADMEIKSLIDQQLRARGMSESTDAPDMIVGFAAGIDLAALELKTDSETELTILESHPRGGLLVILIDAETGFVVWAGAAEGDAAAQPDADTAKVRLAYAVKSMFNELPK
jgi:hypothetical protein